MNETYLTTSWLQRDKLDKARDDARKKPLPSCSFRRRCMDMRCPTCGSAVAGLLKSFVSSQLDERPLWHEYAFTFPELSIPIGDHRPAEFKRARHAVERVIEQIGTDDLLLIATLGLLWDDEGGQKFVAAEIGYISDYGLEPDVPKLETITGERMALLPKKDSSKPFTVSVLQGYTKRSPDTVGPWKPVLARSELLELSCNYGKTSINHRIVTCNMTVGRNGNLVRGYGFRLDDSLTL